MLEIWISARHRKLYCIFLYPNSSPIFFFFLKKKIILLIIIKNSSLGEEIVSEQKKIYFLEMRKCLTDKEDGGGSPFAV